MKPGVSLIYRDLTRWFGTHITGQTDAGLRVVQEISKASGLSCLDHPFEPDTCLQASSEVRREYRLHYSPEDLFHFLLGYCMKAPAGHPPRRFIAADFVGMVVPDGPEAFWELVDWGEDVSNQGRDGNPNGAPSP